MRSRLYFIMVLMFLIVPVNIKAGTKIFISSSADDPVGSRLVYSIKEMIRSSVGYDLALYEEGSAFQLRIVTLDPGDSGYQTVYAIVWTVKNPDFDSKLYIYWDQAVGICGSSRVDNVAGQLIAQTDQLVSDFKGGLIKYFKNQNYRP